MPKDIQVVVNTDAKTLTTEELDILIVSTEGEKPIKTYYGLAEVQADYPKTSAAYKKAAALFNQGKTTLADKLIGKVRIVGVDAPEGLVEKIEAIRAVDDDWYILLTDVSDDATVLALSAWAEATEPTEAELGAGREDYRKLYFGQTDNMTLAVENRRAVIFYTDDLDEHVDTAYVGSVGPFYPKSVTWKWKKLQGVSLPDLTEAQRDRLEEANINFVTSEYKRQYVKNGVCADGEFIDVQMGADYIALDMRNRTYDIMTQNAKVSYTDEGFALIGSGVYSALNRAVELGIIAVDAETGRGVYTVRLPKRNEVSEADARSRNVPAITWEALLEGAVHSVKIKGTLKAQLDA